MNETDDHNGPAECAEQPAPPSQGVPKTDAPNSHPGTKCDDREPNDALDRAMVRWTRIVGIFTLVLAVVGGIQTLAFIQSERAALFFNVVTFAPYPFVRDQPMYAQVDAANTGRAQAFIVDEKIAFHLGLLPEKPTYPGSSGYHAKAPMPAGNIRHILIGPTERLLTQTEIAQIMSGQVPFYVYGFARYSDDFTIFGPREIGFCVVYNSNDPIHSAGPRLDQCDNPAYVYNR